MTMMTVDLRSDIVTLPTEEMRRAIYDAELGDDVSGEDPTKEAMIRKKVWSTKSPKAAPVLKEHLSWNVPSAGKAWR